MDVSVIIVNYHTSELVTDCLRSLYAQCRGVGLEVIVVDNASEPGLQRKFDALFPGLGVKCLQLDENVGFGRANNAGAETATGRNLFFLNPDTILVNDAVSILSGYLDSHPDNWPDRLRYGDNRRFNHTGQPMQVAYITGADLMMPASLFHGIGGFSPDFFMYYEETDLQLRMRRMGLKARLVPGASIKHLEGGSFANKGLTPARFVMSQKSYNYYVGKHYSGLARAWYRFNMVLLRATVLFAKWPFAERLHAYWTVVTNRK